MRANPLYDEIKAGLSRLAKQPDVVGESALNLRPRSEGAGIEQVVGAEPTPELAAQVVEEVQRLLGMLRTEEVRTIALLKLEGYTNAEIAERLGCAVATVERRLNLSRSTWRESPGAEGSTDAPPKG